MEVNSEKCFTSQIQLFLVINPKRIENYTNVYMAWQPAADFFRTVDEASDLIDCTMVQV